MMDMETDEQLQLMGDTDKESRNMTLIPSPSPLDGQEIQDYLNENNLTIVDITVVEEKKQLEDQLKEFKDKAKTWDSEKAKLEQEVKSLGCRKNIFMKQHAKLLGYIRKVAEITEFTALKPSSSKEDSKCNFEFVNDDLLDKFTEHVEVKFVGLKEMKKEVPDAVCDDKPVAVVVTGSVCSPKNVPGTSSTLSVTSDADGSSFETPKDIPVKKKLFLVPVSSCKDTSDKYKVLTLKPIVPKQDIPKKPVIPKLIIKKAGKVKTQQTSVKPQQSFDSSSESSATTSTTVSSNWICEKPNKMKARKSTNISDDEESQPLPSKRALIVASNINRKIKPVIKPVPRPGSSKASSSTSSSASRRSQASSKKWKCTKCDQRLEANKWFKKHDNYVELILMKTKDHNQSLPVKLPKKSRKSVKSPSISPVKVQVGVVKPVGQYETSFLSLSSSSSDSDSDEDMPPVLEGGARASSPQIPEVKSASKFPEIESAPNMQGDKSAPNIQGDKSAPKIPPEVRSAPQIPPKDKSSLKIPPEVNCSPDLGSCLVCFKNCGSMAALNFHMKKKHKGKGVPL